MGAERLRDGRYLGWLVEEKERVVGGRGINVVSLHASQFGRLLYERSGFEASNEMMLYLGSNAVR